MKIQWYRFLLLLALTASTALCADPAPVPIWPGAVPGEKAKLPPEADLTKPSEALIAGKPIIRLGNISTPTFTVYFPEKSKQNGTAIVVLPGGGYNILAYDLEGTEVCQWLNTLGVTSVLLKYRVPGREGLPRYAPALQDAQRTLGLVRENAAKWGIQPERVGILGFSAGGHLSALLSSVGDARTYPVVDHADQLSCRPNFCLLIYPGGIFSKKDAQIVPEIKVDAKAPPTFLAMAEDDPVQVENALAYYVELKKAGVPAELHLYPRGGHGYGLRRTADLVTTWPDRAADWLKTEGWLKP
jgi:acetyl esterase/lipase